MVHAFVMVKTAPGAPKDVREALIEKEAVTEAYVVAGEYDLIVEVEEEAVYDVLDVATETIQSIDGVEETKTYVSMTE